MKLLQNPSLRPPLFALALFLSLGLGVQLARGDNPNNMPEPPVTVPDTVAFTGWLADADGQPLDEEGLDIEFEIHADPEPDEEDEGLWQDELSVDVEQGRFSVELGGDEPFGPKVWTGERRWVRIVINEEPLEPLTPITTVPYAFRSIRSVYLGDESADDIVNRAQMGMEMGDNQAAQQLLTRLEELEAKVALLEDKTTHLASDEIDGQPAVVVESANLHVRNGDSSEINGRGNLILGYNGPPEEGSADRTGSHNLVIGDGHSYTSHHGLVHGVDHRVEAPGAAIIGGEENRILQEDPNHIGSAIVSGRNHEIVARYSAIFGGYKHVIEKSQESAIIGGDENAIIDTRRSFIGGGFGNLIDEEAGGLDAGFQTATIIGGDRNFAGPGTPTNQNLDDGRDANDGYDYITILGGTRNQALGDTTVSVGGSSNQNYGTESAVIGGHDNWVGEPDFSSSTPTSGYRSVIIGGEGSDNHAEFGIVLGGSGHTLGQPDQPGETAYGICIGGEDNELYGAGTHNVLMGGSAQDESATQSHQLFLAP